MLSVQICPPWLPDSWCFFLSVLRYGLSVGFCLKDISNIPWKTFVKYLTSNNPAHLEKLEFFNQSYFNILSQHSVEVRTTNSCFFWNLRSFPTERANDLLAEGPSEASHGWFQRHQIYIPNRAIITKQDINAASNSVENFAHTHIRFGIPQTTAMFTEGKHTKHDTSSSSRNKQCMRITLIAIFLP